MSACSTDANGRNKIDTLTKAGTKYCTDKCGDNYVDDMT